MSMEPFLRRSTSGTVSLIFTECLVWISGRGVGGKGGGGESAVEGKWFRNMMEAL